MEPRNPGRAPSDDAQLIADYLAGEPGVVAQIDRWIGAAASPFRLVLRSDWEDALQEVRFEVFRLLQAGRFRGESSLRTYLWQVTAHSCIDALRHRRRQPTGNAEELDPTLGSKDPSPLERVVESERERRLLEILDKASPECRQLWECILRGQSYNEISGRLGISEGTLRVRAHRCRKRAAEAVVGNGQAPGDAHG